MMSRVSKSSLPVLVLLAGAMAAPTARGGDEMAIRSVTGTYLATAEIARIDARSGRMTLRTQDQTVIVDRDADSPSVRGLRSGASVLVGYRVERDARGRERRVLVALHNNAPGVAPRAPGTAGATVITGTSRGAAVDWNMSASTGVAQPPIVQPWTATSAPPSGGGIPLAYVSEAVPSVPVPTPAPNLALPPASVLPDGAPDTRMLVAARDFQIAAAQLGQAADTMDRAWQGHASLCLPTATATGRDRAWFRLLDGDLPAPDRDDCRAQRGELTAMAQRFRDQLVNASNIAQANGLLPGQVRDILIRNRINL
jgi:hypothetical protein